MKISLKIPTLIIICAVILNIGVLYAGEYAEDYPYFSYERFVPAMVLLEGIPKRGGATDILNQFARYFSNGIYSLSSEDYTRAVNNFIKARRIWPEYFGTDFLLALTYDGKGDYLKAAGYYKGYLNKLKTFESGHYPLSGGVISAIITSDADRHAFANRLVIEHLEYHGINIDEISIPFTTPPSITLFVIMVISLPIMWIIYNYVISPYLRKKKKIENLVGEYWVCENCGKPNLPLIKECEECGRKK